MQSDALREGRRWLARAERDLAAAELTVRGPQALPDIAVYHCQQAAEKALKAFLASHDEILPRTHELVDLAEQCRALDGEFSRFLDAARTLTPYAVRFRYPDGPLEPEASEAEEALALAREVVDYVGRVV